MPGLPRRRHCSPVRASGVPRKGGHDNGCAPPRGHLVVTFGGLGFTHEAQTTRDQRRGCRPVPRGDRRSAAAGSAAARAGASTTRAGTPHARAGRGRGAGAVAHHDLDGSHHRCRRSPELPAQRSPGKGAEEPQARPVQHRRRTRPAPAAGARSGTLAARVPGAVARAGRGLRTHHPWQGLRAAEGGSVLKALVDRLLRQRADVLAFASAPEAMGVPAPSWPCWPANARPSRARPPRPQSSSSPLVARRIDPEHFDAGLAADVLDVGHVFGVVLGRARLFADRRITGGGAGRKQQAGGSKAETLSDRVHGGLLGQENAKSEYSRRLHPQVPAPGRFSPPGAAR